jgi:long-chain fatty acid transport protein
MGKPDDTTAIFHNPAGLTLQEGNHFYYFQSVFTMDLGIRMYDSKGVLHPDHELSPKLNVGALPFLGITSDLGTKNLRVGLAVYAPNAFGSLLDESDPTRYHATKVLFLATRTTGSMAYKLTDKLSIGASLNVIFVYMQAQRMLNPNVLTNPDERFRPASETKPMDARMDLTGTGWTWSWDVGLLFTPHPHFRIGASFASGSNTPLRGDVKLTYAGGKIERSSHRTDMTLPFTLRAGFNWEIVPGFELGSDIFWWHYQVFQEQRSILSTPIMGIEEFRDPKNYGNSWDWCIGLLYRVHPRVEVLAGFQIDATPIPKTTYSLDNPTTNQKGVSGGVRWQATDKVRLGFAVVQNWFDLVDVQESKATPPSNVKGHGADTSFAADVSWQF